MSDEQSEPMSTYENKVIGLEETINKGTSINPDTPVVFSPTIPIPPTATPPVVEPSPKSDED